MKLHSPRFEKALRRDVRKAVRGSRALKRARRAARRPKHYRAQVLLRPMLSLLLGSLVAGVFSQTKQVGAALAVITLWCLVFVAVHAQRFIATIYQSPDLKAFWLLPIEEKSVFRWQLQKFLRGTFWSLIDLIFAYGALALSENVSAFGWMAVIPLAIITWAQVLALALLALVYFRWFPFGTVAVGSYFGAIVLVIGRNVFGKFILAILVHAGPTLNLLLPTGWSASLFRIFLPQSDWLLVLLLLPITATLVTIRRSLARLHYGYHFVEPVMPEPRDLPLEANPEIIYHPEVSTRVGPTEIEDGVLSRAFLRPPAWPERTRFERALWRWLTPRQRILIEFAYPDGLKLSQSWKKIFRNLTISAAGALILNQFFKGGAGYWILAAGLFLTVCHVLFITLNSGRAFNKVFCSGVNIPLYAGYGIGFRELSGTLLRISAIQLPCLAVYCMAAAILTAGLAGLPLLLGLVWGLKLAGFIFLSRFMLLPFGFSSGTNDSDLRLRIYPFLLIPTVILLSLGFLGCCVASFLVPHQGYAAIFFAAAGLIAYGFYRVYAFFYHSNAFDLMNIPQQQ